MAIMKTNHVVVLGDIMLDQYHFGQVTRLNPESPNPLLEVTHTEHRLGGASNVAANLAAMGCQTVLIWPIGDDVHGEIVRSLCSKYHIELIDFPTVQPTITKTRFVETTYNQQLLRADFEEKIVFTQEQKKTIIGTIRDIHPAYTIAADYNKGVLSDELISALGEVDTKLFVDTKSYKIRNYRNMFLLKPNFKEFREIIGASIPNTDQEIEKRGAELAKKLGCHLVITRGKEGASWITPEGIYMHLSTDAQTVFDVSGAGDTFMAGLVRGLDKGMSMAEAVKLGNQASAIAVSKVGTTVVTQEELFIH